ncbi:hypothetical protein R1sor_013509 [Riccia sorocarpa]|uniref:Endonuclease/exonuclease/phosphatase domain-containing protein n=1 Tax=Riccia sorocarpa TaxID=122646 RepID=A0ABD3HAC5_9MARC
MHAKLKPHTRASFDKTRSDNFMSPEKKQNKQPEAMASPHSGNLGSHNAYGGMNTSTGDTGTEAASGKPTNKWDNPLFHLSKQPPDINSKSQANSAQPMFNPGIGDFPPLFVLEEDSITAEVEQEKTTDTTEGDKTGTSLLERHPDWKDNNKGTPQANPYLKGLDIRLADRVSEPELHKAIDGINASWDTSVFRKGDSLHVGAQIFKSRLCHLQNYVFVVWTLDFSPTRDCVVEWARTQLWQKQGIQVEQVRLLSRSYFLIVTGSQEQQQKALSGGPYFINRRMVFALPWDPSFSTSELRSTAMPVWVDLPRVHPCLEQYGQGMLETLGKVLYKTCETSRDSYMHIRGCVIMDVSGELKDHIKLFVEGCSKPMFQLVRYTNIPNVCFSFQQRGHIAKDCPRRQLVTQREETRPESQRIQALTQEGSQLPQASQVNGQNQTGLDPLKESEEPEDLDKDMEGVPNEEDIEVEETTENAGNRDSLQPTKIITSETGEKINTGNEATKGSVTGGMDSATSPSTDGLSSPGEALQMTRKEKPSAGQQGAAQNTKIISWNICGLGSKHRLRTVKNWLRSEHTDAKILALQELKAHETNLRFNLATIFEKGTIVVDYACNEQGGAALILHASIKVLERGVKGDGTAAWASIQTHDGPLNIMSLYAPNKCIERRPVWNWLREKISTEPWVIVGDWNMVELPEDSTCPSTILSGGEERIWKAVSQEYDLIDAYLCSVNTEGPRYTRQVIRGNRLDQSRLDRCYLNNSGEWIYHVANVKHDASLATSDHWPVIVSLAHVPPGHTTVRKGSYYKMNASDFYDNEVLLELKEVWNKHPEGMTDARGKWLLAWKRVKQALVKRDKEKKRKSSPLKELQLELCQLRENIQSQDELAAKESECRKKEAIESLNWRKRSRIRWLSNGDAPSRYFYAQLRAKQVRDSIRFLELEGGHRTTNEAEIKREVQEYYTTLYSSDRQVRENAAIREELLRTIDRTVDEEQNATLAA